MQINLNCHKIRAEILKMFQENYQNGHYQENIQQLSYILEMSAVTMREYVIGSIKYIQKQANAEKLLTLLTDEQKEALSQNTVSDTSEAASNPHNHKSKRPAGKGQSIVEKAYSRLPPRETNDTCIITQQELQRKCKSLQAQMSWKITKLAKEHGLERSQVDNDHEMKKNDPVLISLQKELNEVLSKISQEKEQKNNPRFKDVEDFHKFDEYLETSHREREKAETEPWNSGQTRVVQKKVYI